MTRLEKRQELVINLNDAIETAEPFRVAGSRTTAARQAAVAIVMAEWRLEAFDNRSRKISEDSTDLTE